MGKFVLTACLAIMRIVKVNHRVHSIAYEDIIFWHEKISRPTQEDVIDSGISICCHFFVAADLFVNPQFLDEIPSYKTQACYGLQLYITCF